MPRVPDDSGPRGSSWAHAACRGRLLITVLVSMVAILVAAGSAPVSASPASAATPTHASVSVTSDVPYGAGQQLLDVYRVTSPTPSPVVILIHGGGWSQGDKDKFEDESRGLARAGFVVFDINYTLAADAGPAYPQQVDDVHAALAWVQAHAGEYGGDPTRLGVLGGSAGGYLAAMLAFQANTAAEQPVRVLASLSGPMDVPAIATQLASASPGTTGTCAPLSCAAVAAVTQSMETLLGCDPVECPATLLKAASPTTYVNDYSPPSFFANSTEENVPPSQTESVAALLRAHGVLVKTVVVPGDFHSVELLPAVGAQLLAFLTTNLDATATPTASSVPTTAVTPIAAAANSGHRVYRWLIVAAVLGGLVLIFVVRRLVRNEPPA